MNGRPAPQQDHMKQRSWIQVIAGDERQWQDALRSGADCLIIRSGDQSYARMEDTLRGYASAMPPNAPDIYLQLNGDIIPESRAVVSAALIAGISGVVLCSPANGSDIQLLDVMLSVEEAISGRSVGETRIVAMVGDAPAGILNAASFVGKSDRLIATGWDTARLSRLTGSTGSDALSLAAQAATILTACLCQIGAIDTPDEEEDMDAFRSKCERAKTEGFSGKIAVNIAQIQHINTVFADRT